jgi:uncharacterized membrane protein HdeD (DUF308 family)
MVLYRPNCDTTPKGILPQPNSVGSRAEIGKWQEGGDMTSFEWGLLWGGVISVLFGIAVLVWPRFLAYVVGAYLLVWGTVAFFTALF